MDHSVKTQELLDRMCRYVECLNYTLHKKEAEECFLKTYDVFNLKRPSKIKWVVDIFDKEYTCSASSARSASSAWLAWSTRSARSAWSARSARSASSANSAWSARLAWSTRSARSAWSARSARSASSARSAWSALDYDFDWFIFEFEYCQNPDKDKAPQKNDYLYLEYSELLLKALEFGLGYCVEWEDTLYLAPCPVVRIDAQNRFHSEHIPAINWIGGKAFYYLHGVNFSKDLWLRIINRQMPMREVLAIEDIDQRTQAIKYAKEGLRDFYKSQNGVMIDHYVKQDREGRPINYELWRIPKGEVFTKEVHFAVYDCPTARERGEKKEYSKGVPPFNDIASAMAWGMSNEQSKVTGEEWKQLVPLVDEA